MFRQPSNYANGNTRDQQGRLVTCEHGGRQVTRTEHDGSITVLADGYQGKRPNAPNDVVVAADGAVWFSDPVFGILGDYEGYRAEPELPTYRRVIRRFGAPPSGPFFIPVPADRAEHVPAHHVRALRAHEPLVRGHVGIVGSRVAGMPAVQLPPPLAQGVLAALVRPGDEAVEVFACYWVSAMSYPNRTMRTSTAFAGLDVAAVGAVT